MNKFVMCLVAIALIGHFLTPSNNESFSRNGNSNTNKSYSSDVDKILVAKGKVRNIVNYPDTLSFHEFDTVVRGNTVTLKFTCKNAFGVPETRTMNVDVE
jgi:hypothetical protein